MEKVDRFYSFGISRNFSDNNKYNSDMFYFFL